MTIRIAQLLKLSLLFLGVERSAVQEHSLVLKEF